MIRFVLLVVGLALVLVGIEPLYHAARNRRQAVLSCEQYARERPDAAWVRLTGCDVDYIGAGYRESGGRVAELLFPVRPAGQPRNVPAVAVVSTRDAAALDLAQRTIGGRRQPDQESYLVMMLEIVTALKAAREVEGYARVGLLERLTARRVISGLAGPIDPSSAVIDLHGRPNVLVPAIETAAGAVALLFFLFLQIPRRRPARAPAEIALRGLMLLNLPAEAGVDAVEHAPPLGSRNEVVRRLESALPGLRITGDGRGAVEKADCAIEVSLGAEDPVATAVLDARGAGAVEAVRKLVHVTGWRVYAPRRGTFVESEIAGAGRPHA
jgi:hypothetical protein